MPKGPKIKQWVKWYIRTEALRNHAEPRDSAAQRIEAYLDGKEPVPSRETINKIISSTRNSNDPEDSPWSMSALADYDIPAEAVPVVMKAWTKALKDDKPLTIRQARWIGRLYYLLKDKGTNFLIDRALEYANREKAIKLTGEYPDKPQNMPGLWFRDAILYLQMTGDDSLLLAVMKSMKWKTVKTIAELKAELKIEQKGGGND